MEGVGRWDIIKIPSTSLSLLTSSSKKNCIKLINNLIVYTVYNIVIIINYNYFIKYNSN